MTCLRTAGGYAAAGSCRRPESEAMQTRAQASREVPAPRPSARVRAPVKERGTSPPEAVRSRRSEFLPCDIALTASVLRHLRPRTVRSPRWAAVNATTGHLLYENATSTARSWAEYLASNATDLEQIAGGERALIGERRWPAHERRLRPAGIWRCWKQLAFRLDLAADLNRLQSICEPRHLFPADVRRHGRCQRHVR